MSVTQLDQAGINFMIKQEGLVLHPYLDQVSIPTIGIGCTYYENGQHVQMTDPPITKERAYELFLNIGKQFANPVHLWTKPVLTQNQFNALFSFCYNVGTGGFKGSTVLKLVNQFEFGEPLKEAFLMWTHADGKVLQDLVDRRTEEYELFVS